jgi:hypothetical protein
MAKRSRNFIRTEIRIRQFQKCLLSSTSESFVFLTPKNVKIRIYKLTEGIKDAAKTTLGFAPKRNSRDWFDEECRTAIEARNEARRQYYMCPTRAKEQEYRNHRREDDKICTRKKTVAINRWKKIL